MTPGESHEPARWLLTAPKIPDFAAPAFLIDWERGRQEIRAQVCKLLGELPPKPSKPEVEILYREARAGHVLEKFVFDNGAGATVPGYLLLPEKLEGKAPAVLFCHWHGGEYEIGKEELYQARHMPEAPGPALAARGYVVLGIDAYCFGERNGKGPGGSNETGSAGELSASKFNLWFGRTLWGMILRDDLIALDYLLSRPEVDPERIGVTGISMGATRSWWLMALDERIRTGVAVACLTRYQDLLAHQALREHGIYYFVPGMLKHFDTEAIVALIAPRPILLMNGDRDPGSPVAGIQKIEAAVRPVYRLYEREKNFHSLIYAGLGHVYTGDMWSKTLSWMGQHLNRHAEEHEVQKKKARD